jgi:hypothetical protein
MQVEGEGQGWTAGRASCRAALTRLPRAGRQHLLDGLAELQALDALMQKPGTLLGPPIIPERPGRGERSGDETAVRR